MDLNIIVGLLLFIGVAYYFYVGRFFHSAALPRCDGSCSAGEGHNSRTAPFASRGHCIIPPFFT